MNACRFILLLLLAPSATTAQELRVEAPIGPRGSNGTLYLYLFDPAQVSLEVLPNEEESAGGTLGEALADHQCLAGCTAAAPSQSSPDQSTHPAMVLRQGDKRLKIVRRSQDTPSTKSPLLYTGPILVEGGKINPDLPAGRTARRTLLLTDGGKRWAIAYAPATPLQKLAKALATPKLLGDWQVATAVVLNSGSGAGIWMQRQHAPLYLKEIRKVGTFVGLQSR